MTTSVRSPQDVHADGRIVRAGVAPQQAERAMILVHGRGATPESILTLADELPTDLGFTFVAPGASAATAHPRSWYPSSFLDPVEANEPGLSSGLAKLESAVLDLEAHGMTRENIILLGFSQGACLTLEYAARHARRWGGVAAFTGGLIGERVGRREDVGSFDGTPILLGCSDRDPHVPLWRVNETEAVLRGMGAHVEKRIYPGLPHTIIRDEVEWVEVTMRRLAESRTHGSETSGTPAG